MLQGEARGQLGGRPGLLHPEGPGQPVLRRGVRGAAHRLLRLRLQRPQAYNAGSALQYYLPGYSESVWPAVVGAVLALLTTALIIFGGVRRISAITSGIVPVMAAIYIALGLSSPSRTSARCPMLSMIVSQAFDPKAMFAGIGASCIMQGIKRGLYSNEAGMGLPLTRRRRRRPTR